MPDDFVYPDPHNNFSFSGQQPLFNTPRPNYNPLNSGNQMLDLLFAMYAPNFLGPGRFLPQQSPAQGILDQMASSKYRDAGLRNEQYARSRPGGDQTAIYNTLTGLRARFDNGPLSQLSASHLNNFAGFLGSQHGEMLADMLLGPQNAEDLFYGRRGSQAKLAGSVNRLGFYRPDSIAGGDRMSGQSLQKFTEQIYSNLYGPGADLNDVSGFSAGRVGIAAEDLARRGLLPASLSKLSAAEQRRALQAHAGEFSPQIKDAIDKGGTVEDIAALAGGDTAIRKVDATRVSNAIKEYTKSLSVVREIFGDNGITNAPMQQLLAAMEALTQNSAASMKPGQLENLMRRTQMASRDSGVSLEALMGLTARAGALADKYGLSREAAPEHVISAMEHIKAMRETGGFLPGFGRIDPEKSGMFKLEQNARADSSMVGKLLGAASRLVEENRTGTDANGKPTYNAAFAGKGKNLIKMVEALRRGDATYYDETQKREVNIYEELGARPVKHMNTLFDEAGISREQSAAYFDDPNTQEFAIRGRTAFAQAVEIKRKIASRFLGTAFAPDADISQSMDKSLTQEQKTALLGNLSRGYASALIDTSNTATMTAAERVEVIHDSMLQSVKNYVRQNNPGFSEDQVNAQAKELFVGEKSVFGFKTLEDVYKFAATQQGHTGLMLQAEEGAPLGLLQQQLNARLQTEEQGVSRRNIARAHVLGNVAIGDGSNFLQRIHEYIANPNADIGSLFGAINSADVRKKLYEKAGGKDVVESAFGALREVYDTNLINTEKEQEELVAGLNKDSSTFADVKSKFAGTAGEDLLAGKTQYVSGQTLTQRLRNKNISDDVQKTILLQNGVKPSDIKAMDANARLDALSKIPGLKFALANQAVDTAGIFNEGDITEAELRRIQQQEGTHAFAVNTPEGRAQVATVGRLGREMDAGNITAKSVFDLFGGNIKDKKKREELEAAFTASVAEHDDEDKKIKFESLLDATNDLDDKTKAVIKDFGEMGRKQKVNGGLNALAGPQSEMLTQMAAMTEAIGPAVGEAIKTVLGGELKIENVTIANFKLPGLMSALGAVLSTGLASTGSPANSGAENVAITGTIRIIDLENGVLQLVNKGKPVPTVAGETPVVGHTA